jgi:hypothetical protein
MTSKKRQPKKEKRKYERHVSLWGMTFDEAVTRIAKAKPKKYGDKKRA